ncbi:hypothetical protein KKG61_02615, partial [bacterium]|nr:hypothetical protein [bacterium]MBU1598992.1 hypothetical protein [bacterium]
MQLSMKLSSIHLYNNKTDTSLKISLLLQYIKEKTGLEVDLREITEERVLAEEFARAKVIDPHREELNPNPLKAEIEYEYKIISGQKPSGLLYDGFCLQEIYRQILPRKEHNLAQGHIIFTTRLFGTFSDNRYHARVAVFGHPTIISTTGIVVSPAKPREFYLRKQPREDPTILANEFRGRFIEYDDKRLTEIMKGYVMQAFFYQVFGNPFCSDPNCRLYNAHWQEEVINAQLKSKYEFCQLHYQALTSL